MYAVHAAVLGAVFVVLGLGVSAVVRNRYLALLLPFASFHRLGEICGIVGINGAGKSVLLKMICGFALPDEGYAILDGEEFSCLKIQMDRDTISRILKK